jgi:hypothetical protein
MSAARALFVAGLLAGLAAASPSAAKKGWSRPAPPPPALPPPALDDLPRVLEISHVDVLASEDAALVTTDLLLARGAWNGAGFDVYVAYGAPGLPEAFEARVLPLPTWGVLPLQTAVGDVLATAHAHEAPSHAAFSLGRARVAGQLVHVGEEALKKAFGDGDRAFVRLRAVYRFVGTTRLVPSVLVRLDTPRLGPLPLGAVTIRTEGGSALGNGAATVAALCGLEKASVPMRIAQSPEESATGLVAPSLVKRTAGDDLCITLR